MGQRGRAVRKLSFAPLAISVANAYGPRTVSSAGAKNSPLDARGSSNGEKLAHSPKNSPLDAPGSSNGEKLALTVERRRQRGAMRRPARAREIPSRERDRSMPIEQQV